jgi:hypothetical protein
MQGLRIPFGSLIGVRQRNVPDMMQDIGFLPSANLSPSG